MFDHVYAEETARAARASATSFAAYLAIVRGGTRMSEPTTRRSPSPRRLNMGLRKAMEDDPKVLIMGEDIGKLGGVFRVTDGLQKDFGEDRVIDTPAGRVRHRRHRDRPGDARLPAGRARSSSTASSTRRSTRSSARSRRCTTARRARSPMPIVIRIPFGGGIGAVEHHSESPEAYFAHTPGPQGGRLLQPGRRLLDDPAGDRLRRPGHLLRAEAAVPRGQGRARRDARRPTRCSPRASSARAATSPCSPTARW